MEVLEEEQVRSLEKEVVEGQVAVWEARSILLD